MPSAIHDRRRAKFAATMQPAIFLGYVLQPGVTRYREGCYVFLDDLADMSFYSKVRWSKARVTVHSSREFIFDEHYPVVFPCRAQYKRDKETLVGIQLGLEDIRLHRHEVDEDVADGVPVANSGGEVDD